MQINFNHYVQYRGRQFEKLFPGKRTIIYITDPKEWLAIFPDDKHKLSKSSGLSNSSGYIYVDPTLDMIERLDAVILHEVTHVFEPELTEREVEQSVKVALGN